MDVTEERAHRAWRVAERIKRLSDDLIPLGPWGIGLDGVLAWIPGANTLYSLGAGGLLVSEVPIVGWAMDTLFRGHFMAARALQKDIEARFGAAEMPASWARPRKRRLWSGRSLARS
jgi:hypothetical protein